MLSLSLGLRILVQLAQELSGSIHTLPPHRDLDAFREHKRVLASLDLARSLIHVSQASPPLVSALALTNILLQGFPWQGTGNCLASVSKLNREAL